MLIAPTLFNILTFDLAKAVSKHVTIVQYADDICMWMPVTFKNNSPKRSVNYIRKIFQNDLTQITNYMLDNGLNLSKEKTKLVLFNSGLNPKSLPTFKIENSVINYQQKVKFLGLILTPKLNWSLHIQDILTGYKEIEFFKGSFSPTLGTRYHCANSFIYSLN